MLRYLSRAALGALALTTLAWLALAGVGHRPAVAADVPAGMAKATFASGCFWCTESDFDKVEGVVSTTSGYIGGHVVDPTYKQVTTGTTGHAEAVEIVYDPKKVTYDQLLDHYWKNVDPFDADGQFCDQGSSYRPAIFVHGAEQRRIAEESKARIARQFSQPIVVEIVDAPTFYPAEDYHQDFYKTNAFHYMRYRAGCGRDYRLQQIEAMKAKS